MLRRPGCSPTCKFSAAADRAGPFLRARRCDHTGDARRGRVPRPLLRRELGLRAVQPRRRAPGGDSRAALSHPRAFQRQAPCVTDAEFVGRRCKRHTHRRENVARCAGGYSRRPVVYDQHPAAVDRAQVAGRSRDARRSDRRAAQSRRRTRHGWFLRGWPDPSRLCQQLRPA